ncbi:MAG: FHA domain-containing protein [Deltaproteobacteria bacterium]|nr:MAG: FHA domain-containing protein [Deltaproteobacteria bacterium]TMQ15438.1 MAG: FHA domain-containing protein [Deltaproteobacteria bacterium]
MKETVTYARAQASGALILLAMLPDRLETWTLPGRGKAVVGRDPSCDITLDHPSISRVHAELELGARVLVRDRGSRNGVTVDGIAVGAGEAAEIVVGGTAELGEITVLLQRRGSDLAPGEPTQMISIGDHDAIVGGTLVRLLDLIRRVAPGERTVLIVGETGVGKDFVAELVHRASPRARGPFVRVHCAALPSTLFESELFGHERGAFTGATTQKQGLIEAAHGGTVFLDEVGEIPPSMQVKLLRVLEDRRVTRIGSTSPRVVDVRFVAATNCDLARAVKDAHFREDLYYRLCGFTVAIPPLRERSDEIIPLAEMFLARASRGRPLVLGNTARQALAEYAFPGNVRELRLTVERAAALVSGPAIEVSDLRLEIPLPACHDDAALLAALESAAGNQSEAARRLGISRRTLVARLAVLRGRAG